MEKGKTMTAEEVRQRIRMDLEKSRGKNKAMLQETRLKAFGQIFGKYKKKNN